MLQGTFVLLLKSICPLPAALRVEVTALARPKGIILSDRDLPATSLYVTQPLRADALVDSCREVPVCLPWLPTPTTVNTGGL